MQDQQNAFATAKWLQTADGEGGLGKFLNPRLEPNECRKAEVESSILGIL